MSKVAVMCAAICLLLGACNEKPTNWGKSPYIFPNETGDWWVYEVTSLPFNGTDTVQVLVRHQDTLNNGDAVTLWITKYRYHTDTSFVQVKKGAGNGVGRDTVYVFNDRGATSTVMVYLFPMEVGMAWPGINEFDTVRVTGKSQIVTEAGTYDAFLVHNGWHQFEWAYQAVRWVVPYVGVVYMRSAWLFGTEMGQDKWELLAWSGDGYMPQPD